ncbi:MAG TPA: type II toxin-antitoxin system prevent-host-death family antitoxin [Rhodothermales bacterium]|nr:type II toxin-antitoxin system prevent-host-death family antitoxin [Rhodothermales bacterium]
MQKIGAAKFKAQCLALLDDLDPEGLIITKRGKPVARVLPIPKRPEELIGSLDGKVKVKGDILSTGMTWYAHAES